jgi:hypothetical protein
MVAVEQKAKVRAAEEGRIGMEREGRVRDFRELDRGAN